MIYRIRLHPAVSDDLAAIARLISDYAGPASAGRKLAEIENVIASLQGTPHKGSLRNEIALGLRAIPAGRKGVVVFTVDDDRREVLIHAIGYAGQDWMTRSMARTW
ncbi:type II toxin-antitoxin system RelE/ParE family toxin [Paracoccus sp. (in: a-proteobacteria)]|uniref:type II toxin-antitoxin system RelE/ParE family toxin n=1 Tax=Paracoccus sp. TaxID=267 RepID=UPI0032201047